MNLIIVYLALNLFKLIIYIYGDASTPLINPLVDYRIIILGYLFYFYMLFVESKLLKVKIKPKPMKRSKYYFYLTIAIIIYSFIISLAVYVYHLYYNGFYNNFSLHYILHRKDILKQMLAFEISHFKNTFFISLIPLLILIALYIIVKKIVYSVALIRKKNKLKT